MAIESAKFKNADISLFKNSHDKKKTSNLWSGGGEIEIHLPTQAKEDVTFQQI